LNRFHYAQNFSKWSKEGRKFGFVEKRLVEECAFARIRIMKIQTLFLLWISCWMWSCSEVNYEEEASLPPPTEEELKSGLVVMDFWAPWCGPCRTMNPIYKKVSEAMKDTANFYKVNVDEEKALSKQFDIQSIPTIVILKEGEVVYRKSGVIRETALKSAVQKWAETGPGS
jgi:thioredoxin 1